MENRLAQELLALPYVIAKTDPNRVLGSTFATIINRKEDRFTLTRREFVTGETPKGKKWSRWRSAESVTVSIKTPKYLGFATVCAFHKTKSGLKNITPSIASVRSIFPEFEKEYNALILRTFYKEKIEEFEYIFFTLTTAEHLASRLIDIHYPLLSHATGESARKMPEHLIRNFSKVRTFENFINFLGYEQDNLISYLKNKYDTNSLTMNDIAILSICLNKTYSENNILVLLKIIESSNSENSDIYKALSTCKPEQLRGIVKKTPYLVFLKGLKGINSDREQKIRFTYLSNLNSIAYKEACDMWSTNYKSLRASKKKLCSFSSKGIKEYIKENTSREEPLEEVTSRFMPSERNSMFYKLPNVGYILNANLSKKYDLYKNLKPYIQHKRSTPRANTEIYMINGREQDFVNTIDSHIDLALKKAGSNIEKISDNSRKMLFKLLIQLNSTMVLGMERYKGKLPKTAIRMAELELPDNLVFHLLKKNITNNEILLMKNLPHSQIASIYALESFGDKHGSSFDF